MGTETGTTLDELLANVSPRLAKRPEPGADVRASIAEILANNGVGSEAPTWFVDLWQSVLHGRAAAREHFPSRDMGDTANALAELDQVMPGGPRGLRGGDRACLPARRGRVFICREGMDGTHFYEVLALNDA